MINFPPSDDLQNLFQFSEFYLQYSHQACGTAMPLASYPDGTSSAVRLELVQAAKGYNPGESLHALLHIRDESALVGTLGRRQPQHVSTSQSDQGLNAGNGGTEHANGSTEGSGGQPPSTVHPQRHSAEPVQLEDICITFKGIERVDTSWVSKSYRKDVKPLNADTRRVQRPVIEASLRASTARDFGEDECRVYLIRFRLPEWLPPSFHGLVVRYSYYLDIRVRWTFGDGAGLTATEERTTGAPVFETRLRDIVHVWPSTGGKSHGGAMDGFRGQESGGSQSTSGDRSMSKVKCWEVGFGTTIDDAIENVELLRHDSSNSVPYSPAYLTNSLSRTSSLEPERGGRSGLGAGQAQSQEPSALLARKLFQAAQDAISADKKGTNLRIMTEESASVVESGTKPLPKTPIAGASNPRERYWDGMSGTMSSFRLRVRDMVFVTIHLHPAAAQFEEGRGNALTPGSSFVGTLEFLDTSDVRCVKYMVSLEMEETVAEAWRWKGRGHVLNSIVEERASLSPDTLASCVYFTLPSDATPGFESDVVTLTWGLRFEFFFVPTGGGGAEKVEWKIPIKFGPPQ